MQRRTKVYILAAAVVASAIVLGAGVSHFETRRLERRVSEAQAAAEAAERRAAESETASAGYVQKIEYLERQLATLRETAGKQDDELKKLTSEGRGARRRVDAARRSRPADTTDAELCERLNELGHPCR